MVCGKAVAGVWGTSTNWFPSQCSHRIAFADFTTQVLSLVTDRRCSLLFDMEACTLRESGF